MSIHNVLAGIMTKDIKTATLWYEQLLGRSPDTRPMEGLEEWNFPQGGVLQLVQDEERAGLSSITFIIESRASQLDELKALGIAIGPMTETEYVKTVTVNDPEGNRITFAENLR